MILTLALCMAARDNAQDFFPLKPGDTWVYESHNGKATASVLSVVGQPTAINGHDTTPIEVSVDSKTISTGFYEVAADGIYLLGANKSQPYSSPRPFLKLTDSTSKWSWDGLDGGQQTHIDAVASRKGKANVLGQQADEIDVTFDGVVKLNAVNVISFKQTMRFAKGIGMFEMDNEQTVNSQKLSQKMTLTKFQPAPN